MGSLLTESAERNNLSAFLADLLLGDLTNKMYKEARKVHPLRRVEIAKSEMVGAPPSRSTRRRSSSRSARKSRCRKALSPPRAVPRWTPARKGHDEGRRGPGRGRVGDPTDRVAYQAGPDRWLSPDGAWPMSINIAPSTGFAVAAAMGRSARASVRRQRGLNARSLPISARPWPCFCSLPSTASGSTWPWGKRHHPHKPDAVAWTSRPQGTSNSPLRPCDRWCQPWVASEAAAAILLSADGDTLARPSTAGQQTSSWRRMGWRQWSAVGLTGTILTSPDRLYMTEPAQTQARQTAPRGRVRRARGSCARLRAPPSSRSASGTRGPTVPSGPLNTLVACR